MSTSEFSYIPESPEQSFGNNKGIFTPTDIYDLVRDNKWSLIGNLELIETINASGGATIDFTSIKETVYDVHLLTFANVQSSANNDVAGIRLYESGVLETANVYEYALQSNNTDPSFTEIKSTGDSKIRFLGGYSTNFNFTGNGYIYFYNLGDSTKYSFCSLMNTTGTDGNDYNSQFGSGVLPQTSTVDGIRLFNYFASGNFDEGVFSLYGIQGA
tara:strand:+ start:1602 stop:2246 length:645 start_codon:yes stop_codon:yes gene_type:complete